MVKLMLCMRRLPHLTRDEFQRYWRDEHSMVVPSGALRELGIRRYVRVFPVAEEINEDLRVVRGSEAEFDGIAEIWLDGVDDYFDRWTSGPGLEAVKAFLEDERSFVDWNRSVFFLAEEEAVVG